MRFKLIKTKQGDIIADLNSLKKNAEFGDTMQGFIRKTGKRVIGYFGSNLVTEGQDSDIYYAPMFYLDGQWSYSENPEITKGSGTGKLFKDLENFTILQGATL